MTTGSNDYMLHGQRVPMETLTGSRNNRHAPGYGDPATGQQYSSIFRSQLLDNNIADYMQVDHRKLTLPAASGSYGDSDAIRIMDAWWPKQSSRRCSAPHC